MMALKRRIGVMMYFDDGPDAIPARGLVWPWQVRAWRLDGWTDSSEMRDRWAATTEHFPKCEAG